MWIKTIILLLFIALSSPFEVIAQQPNRCNNTLNGDYLLSYGHAAWFTIKQPLQYKAKDWAVVGGAVAATALVYVYDEEIFNFFDNHFPDETQDELCIWADSYGSGYLSIPMLGGFYLAGVIWKDNRAKHAALAGLQSFVIAGATGWIIKHTTQRARPSQQEVLDPRVWEGPFGGHGYNAFPSGHTICAFALATTLGGIYNDKPWLGAGMYALAGLTAYSRAVSGKHWPSDILAGAVLGYGIGRAVLLFNHSKQAKCIEPSISANGIGMRVKL